MVFLHRHKSGKSVYTLKIRRSGARHGLHACVRDPFLLTVPAVVSSLHETGARYLHRKG